MNLRIKSLVATVLLSIGFSGHADTRNNAGDIVSKRLILESSGFWGSGRFTALPDGNWIIVERQTLSGNNATHTGYLLSNQNYKGTLVPIIVVIHSTTPNFWNASFSAVPADASAVNLYKSSSTSFVDKQSFFFPDLSLTNYRANWLNALKVKRNLLADQPLSEYALSVTRGIDRTNDIQLMSFIKKEGSDLDFEARVKNWNDQLVGISYDSFYGKKDSTGVSVVFNDSEKLGVISQESLAAAVIQLTEAPLAVVPTTVQPFVPERSEQLEEQAQSKERELLAARLENDLLRQQLAESQKPVSPTIAIADAVSAGRDQGLKRESARVRRHALIIGNNDYKNVPRLDNAVGDAKSIATLLGRLEYNVVTYNNLNEKNFKAALRQFKQQLRGGEEVVFFFAGHGVQLGSENFLLPIDVGSDSEDQIRDEGIRLERVLSDFAESKVKFSLAVVDACRDNPFKSKGRSIGGRGLASTSAASGQMIIFSAGVGQQALDRLGNSDKEKNGVFTRVLIDKAGKSKEPIHLLMREVRTEVARLAQTVGHEQVPAIYDQAIGDFYFVPQR